MEIYLHKKWKEADNNFPYDICTDAMDLTWKKAVNSVETGLRVSTPFDYLNISDIAKFTTAY